MESYRITADEARRRLEEGNLEYVYTNRFMCDTSLDHLKKFSEKGQQPYACLLYTSDAADDLLCVDLGGRRIIKKKNKTLRNQL